MSAVHTYFMYSITALTTIIMIYIYKAFFLIEAFERHCTVTPPMYGSLPTKCWPLISLLKYSNVLFSAEVITFLYFIAL